MKSKSKVQIKQLSHGILWSQRIHFPFQAQFFIHRIGIKCYKVDVRLKFSREIFCKILRCYINVITKLVQEQAPYIVREKLMIRSAEL